jgi:hypothetical protein
MSRKIFNVAVLSLLVLSLVSSAAAADVSVDIRDTDGDDLDDFDLEVTGETDLERENLDRAELNLDEGEYNLEISKEGYIDIERTIFVEEDEDSSYRFTMEAEEEERDNIVITSLDAPKSVCSGQSFPATVRVENQGEEDRVVSMTGTGLGRILVGSSFVVDAGESKRYRFIFTGVKGSGELEYRINANSVNSDSITGRIDVNECDVPGDPDTVTGIDMNVYPVGGNDRAYVNELVRVRGFADGSRGSVPLDLSVDGEDVADISTDPGGYFETYFRPEKAGELTVTVSATEASDSASLRVEPSPSVSKIRAPREVFAGENFKICSDVESAINPEVVLLENGEVIESRLAGGEVCFEIQAPDAGEYSYEMRALTYGRGDSAETAVNVLEQGPEAESFPGQIATVETEPGILKVEIYNTDDRTKNYTARLENLPQEWVSDVEKNVTLRSGDRDTIYFYVSPGKQGSHTGILEVESGGEIIHSDDIEMYTADTRRDGGRDFLETYLKLLYYLL